MKMYSYLWMAVTADEYELPICVADTSRELARMLGISRESMMQMKSRQSKRKNPGRNKGYKVVSFKFDEKGELVV